jgi:hypothetical protein
MKKKVKNILSKALSPVATRLGYTKKKERIADLHNKNNLLDIFYSTLLKINFDPIHIVDIGANHGTWTRETLQYFPTAYFTLFEPQYWMEDSIKDILQNNPKVKFNAVGAGEKFPL